MRKTSAALRITCSLAAIQLLACNSNIFGSLSGGTDDSPNTPTTPIAEDPVPTPSADDFPTHGLFVDGACAESGIGVNFICGENGPFRTIAEGVAALAPGEQLNIRGAHDAFDGIYRERVDLRGKACASDARCTLYGFGDVRVRGMRAETDWVAAASGAWVRAQEESLDAILVSLEGHPQRDAWTPGTVFQSGLRTDGQFTALGYAGDGVLTPGDGQWGYDPTTHELYVDPYGDAIGDVFVPFVSRLVQLTSFVTVENIRFEGARTVILDKHGWSPAIEDLQFRNVGFGYTVRYLARLSNTPGLTMADVWFGWAGRGVEPMPNSAGGYCLRVFGAHNAQLTRITCEHIGSNCTTCDPPWNNRAFSPQAYGRGLDLKQTTTAEVTDFIGNDGAVQGAIHVDSSRNVTISNPQITNWATGIAIDDQSHAPDPCDLANPEHHCTSSMVRVLNASIDHAEYGIRIQGWVQPDAAYTAEIVDAQITNTDTPFEIASEHIVLY